MYVCVDNEDDCDSTSPRAYKRVLQMEEKKIDVTLNNYTIQAYIQSIYKHNLNNAYKRIVDSARLP